jgi:hypothetical protein
MVLLGTVLAAGSASAAPREVQVQVMTGERLGPMEMDRFALGQGGLSPEPMWEDRAAEVRALHPRVIRLFVQEYFDLLPERGRYHFDTLDQSVDLILKAGAKPLMSLCMKPHALFPKVDQDVVEPTDYGEWERLISALVRHYRERGSGIRYWEVGNEPDLGEPGGCPYRFTPEAYARYYQHTVAAILREDPQAKVGGPALASPGSPILPALLEACERDKTPLHFVSWHIYNTDPTAIRGTIDSVRALVAKHPALHPELVLDEWNMDLFSPPEDPRYQPCYIAEVAYQMREGGLDLSCYYHLRDYHVEESLFRGFMSAEGAAFMARWWNRNLQVDGLFDYQSTVRPSYFTLKLLARLTGERLRLTSSDARLHGFAAREPSLGDTLVLLWNFSSEPAHVSVELRDLPSGRVARRLRLDAQAPNPEENSRLRRLPTLQLQSTSPKAETDLEPYGLEFWSIERP